MEKHDEKMKMSELLELKKSNMLSANHEYQRGAVWSQVQQKKLIDSVLRGYPLPLFYLHFKKTKVGTFIQDKFDVIDGQQRINALFAFHEGHFKLFDPAKDDKIARFPKFIIETACPWAGCSYDDLDAELKQKFDNTELLIVQIETDSEHEARDLFIRLQAGLPLNAQEKRDAWPGGFTEFVLKFAGKKELAHYPGHEFFNKWVKKSTTDRGAIRTLCAQVGMLIFENAAHDNWSNINSDDVDNYYYQNIDFDITSSNVVRFKKTLEIANRCLSDYQGRHLQSHEAIHVLLLIESLLDDYTPSWLYTFTQAFDEFRKKIAEAQKEKSGEYWDGYASWVRTASAQGAQIKRRHLFFLRKIFASLKLIRKDTVRNFGEVERQIIYYEYDRKCAVCKQEIAWDELDIHHVEEHQNGGKTILDNAVPVHRTCHPKGQAATDFLKQFNEKKSAIKETKNEDEDAEWTISSFPNDTKCKFEYKSKTYNGVINDGILTVDNNFGEFNTFRAASVEITNLQRNGWDDWEVFVPEYQTWIKAVLCRKLFNQ
jgi:hypothetical protein